MTIKDQRSTARAKLAFMLGIYAGSQPRTPLADEPFMKIGNETLTWLDMLLLTDAENPQQYCRGIERTPVELRERQQ